MSDEAGRETDDELVQGPLLRGDRPYTLRLTAICLTGGLLVAIPVGLLLYSLRQPLSVTNSTQVNWTPGAFAFPLALLVSGAILAASVFVLPVRIARRAERVLDPTLWPALGVFSLTALLVLAFIAGIVLRII